MQAVVLLGGLGTRLYPLTYTTPKVLLPIADGPFLSHLLDWLFRSGVTETIFAVSNLSEEIANAVRDTKRNMSIRIVRESTPLGSAGAIKNCAHLLKDNFLLLNGDILMDVNLADLFHAHISRNAAVTVTVSEVEDPSPFGIIVVTEDNRVLDWQEKPARHLARSNLANVGAWAIASHVLDSIAAHTFVSLEKETFPLLIRSGAKFCAYHLRGYWKDIGTPEKYFHANIDYLEGRIGDLAAGRRQISPGIYVKGNVTIEEDVKLTGPVVIGSGTQIGRGSTIIGPTAIGPDVTIGPRSTIRTSVIWSGSQIGSNVSLEGSIIAGVTLGDNCTVAKSVIAQGSSIAAGTQLRPGTILGPRSVIP
jgi:mannose-1-phosphate guanylyltransferase